MMKPDGHYACMTRAPAPPCSDVFLVLLACALSLRTVPRQTQAVHHRVGHGKAILHPSPDVPWQLDTVPYPAAVALPSRPFVSEGAGPPGSQTPPSAVWSATVNNTARELHPVENRDTIGGMGVGRHDGGSSLFFS